MLVLSSYRNLSTLLPKHHCMGSNSSSPVVPIPKIVESCHAVKAHFRLEDIEKSDAEADIRCFLQVELPNLGDKIEAIVKDSAGVFIYAATIVRYLSPKGVPPTVGQQAKQLDHILEKGLGQVITGKDQLVDALYSLVIEEVLQNS